MTTPEALEKINRAIGTLKHQIEADNTAGFYSKNRLLEDLFLPILRIVLHSPSLRNLNQESTNFPHVDLADDQERVAIQVTTERTAKKVTSTIEGFIDCNYHKRWSRLVFLVLSNPDPKYNGTSRKNWARLISGKFQFHPETDVLTPSTLYANIAALLPSEISQIQEIFNQSIFGENHIDIRARLESSANRQLRYEIATRKYIPDIFVDTPAVKEIARHFTHPTLFFHRTLDSFRRQNIFHTQELARKSGLPEIQLPDFGEFENLSSIDGVELAAKTLSKELRDLLELFEKYKKIKYNAPDIFPIEDRCRNFYEQNIFNLQNTGSSWVYNLRELLVELSVIEKKVFILTGRAGQGKTNFVCDFIQNFLIPHDIPCAYLSGRRIGATSEKGISSELTQITFGSAAKSFSDWASIVNSYAIKINKPFVIVIDGLNEHHRLTEFAEQLEYFIDTISDYPAFRLLLTCRSEFFRQRFERLTETPTAERVFYLSKRTPTG
ncbi:MAG: SMEK domain-containing protein [Opitutaceae bacterium]